MIKATAMAILFPLLVYLYAVEKKEYGSRLKTVLKYAVPLVPVLAFLIWQAAITGRFSFINDPGNTLFTLDAGVILAKFFKITKWLFLRQYRIVLSLLMVISFIVSRRSWLRKEFTLFLLIFIFSGYSFMGIYFLPRYLMPALPYFFMAGAWALTGLCRSKRLAAALVCLIMILQVSSFWDTDIRGNFEWNMNYLKAVETQKEMCGYIEQNFPDKGVITLWSFNDQLSFPHLGYVARGIRAVLFDDRQKIPPHDLVLVGQPGRPVDAKLKELAVRERLRLHKRTGAGIAACELFAGK